MPTPALAKLVGLIVAVTGLVAAGIAVSRGASWITPLIPVVVGAVLFICGQVATSNPNARKHAMHAAAAVALLGALGSARGPVLALTGGAFVGYALAAQVIVLVACVVFLVFAIKSFIDARKARSAA